MPCQSQTFKSLYSHALLNLEMFKNVYSCHVLLEQLDKHQASKAVLISCEFNSHWRQFYSLLKAFETTLCQFYTDCRQVTNPTSKASNLP